MKVLHERCAGLDVHKDEVVACVRVEMRPQATHEVRRFATTTRGLLELRFSPGLEGYAFTFG